MAGRMASKLVLLLTLVLASNAAEPRCSKSPDDETSTCPDTVAMLQAGVKVHNLLHENVATEAAEEEKEQAEDVAEEEEGGTVDEESAVDGSLDEEAAIDGSVDGESAAQWPGHYSCKYCMHRTQGIMNHFMHICMKANPNHPACWKGAAQHRCVVNEHFANKRRRDEFFARCTSKGKYGKWYGPCHKDGGPIAPRGGFCPRGRYYNR